MDKSFDYKGTRDLLLSAGMILTILGPFLSWISMVVGGLCFVIAIICHTRYVGQLLTEDNHELRKRLQSVEDTLAGQADAQGDDVQRSSEMRCRITHPAAAPYDPACPNGSSSRC